MRPRFPRRTIVRPKPKMAWVRRSFCEVIDDLATEGAPAPISFVLMDDSAFQSIDLRDRIQEQVSIRRFILNVDSGLIYGGDASNTCWHWAIVRADADEAIPTVVLSGDLVQENILQRGCFVTAKGEGIDGTMFNGARPFQLTIDKKWRYRLRTGQELLFCLQPFTYTVGTPRTRMRVAMTCDILIVPP